MYDPEPGWLECPACPARWAANTLATSQACPECGCTTPRPTWKEIPEPSPAASIVLAVEPRIPRAENSAILTTHMRAYLEMRGVTSRRDLLAWERWLNLVGDTRAELQAEMMPDPHAPAGEEGEGDA